MIGDVGAPELLIILAIVIVLFGASRVADIGKGIGRGIRDFRRELHEPSDAPVALGDTEAEVRRSSEHSTLPPALRH